MYFRSKISSTFVSVVVHAACTTYLFSDLITLLPVVEQFKLARCSLRNFVFLPLLGSRDSTVSTVTRLRTGLSEIRIPVGTRDFRLLQNVLTGFGAHSASMSTGVLSRG